MKRRLYLILSPIFLFIVVAVLLHAGQVWPVQQQQLIGTYQNTQNASDTIVLKANGEYLHIITPQKYSGQWSLNQWDGDISLLNIQFKGKAEFNDSYMVGSRFGYVSNLYIAAKSSEQWKKITTN